MRRIVTFFLLTMFACSFWGGLISSVQAQEPVTLTDQQEKLQLGLHLEYLADPTGGLTIDDVASAKYERQFIPSEAEIPTIGFTDAAYWLRVRLRNESLTLKDWRLIVNQPYLDFIDLYLPDTTGQFQVKRAALCFFWH